MRAKFIRNTENPFDSLDIGRVEQRKSEMWKRPIMQALKGITINLNGDFPLENHTGEQGAYLEYGFMMNGYYFFMGWDKLKDIFYVGCSELTINITGHQEFINKEYSEEETIDDCIYTLRSIVKSNESKNNKF